MLKNQNPGFRARKVLSPFLVVLALTWCCRGGGPYGSLGAFFGMLREHKRSIVAPDSKTKAAPQDMRN